MLHLRLQKLQDPGGSDDAGGSWAQLRLYQGKSGRHNCVVCSARLLLSAQDMERRKAHDAKELRDLSRQMYLTKREQQKLDELRDKIEDEERLFAVRALQQHAADTASVSLKHQQKRSRMQEGGTRHCRMHAACL